MSTNKTHLDFAARIANEICQHLQAKESLSLNESFILGLSERLKFSVKGIDTLLCELQDIPELEFSIGIILRAMLLDILIGLNFYRIVSESYLKGISSEEMLRLSQEFSEQMLSDGLDKTLDYFELSYKLGFISEKDLLSKYDAVESKYNIFFKKRSNCMSRPVVKHKKFHAPKKLFELLANSSTKKLSQLYDQYLFYSKYDHFGIQYMDIIRIQYSFKMQVMSEVIQHLSLHAMNIAFMLNIFYPSDFAKAKSEESESYVRENYFVSN